MGPFPAPGWVAFTGGNQVSPARDCSWDRSRGGGGALIAGFRSRFARGAKRPTRADAPRSWAGHGNGWRRGAECGGWGFMNGRPAPRTKKRGGGGQKQLAGPNAAGDGRGNLNLCRGGFQAPFAQAHLGREIRGPAGRAAFTSSFVGRSATGPPGGGTGGAEFRQIELCLDRPSGLDLAPRGTENFRGGGH